MVPRSSGTVTRCKYPDMMNPETIGFCSPGEAAQKSAGKISATVEAERPAVTTYSHSLHQNASLFFCGHLFQNKRLSAAEVIARSDPDCESVEKRLSASEAVVPSDCLSDDGRTSALL